MVEELILSGADIIKVGIGPGKLAYWGTLALFSGTELWSTSLILVILLRLCVYHPEENWSRVPTA